MYEFSTNLAASEHRLKAVHFTIVLLVITSAADDSDTCVASAADDGVTRVVRRRLSSSTARMLSTAFTPSNHTSDHFSHCCSPTKPWYTLATKLNSTQLTLLKVPVHTLWPRTHWPLYRRFGPVHTGPCTDALAPYTLAPVQTLWPRTHWPLYRRFSPVHTGPCTDALAPYTLAPVQTL